MKNTELKTEIIELADALREERMPELTDELFGRFEKNGNRLDYENVYFPRRRFLAVYGLAAMIGKRKEDVQKLEYVLEEILNEKTWALPAHCDTKKRPEIEKEVDLFNAETAGALSEILKEVGSLLDRDLKERVKNEIGRRVILPFTREGARFGFEHAHHNWNAVCCGSIGTAILNLGDELIGKEKKDNALLRINSSLSTFVGSFPDDGACLEGAGYFNYGISFLIAYARRFIKETAETPEFVSDPKLKKIADFPNAAFFSCGRAVNFSDACEEERLHAGTLQGFTELCGTKYSIPQKVLADFDTDPCYRFLPLLDDLRYGGDFKTNPIKQDGRFVFLPHAEWVIAENGQGAAFAIKGGNNAEPHNHNDVGSYIYLSGDTAVACELGAGEYTADYFGQGRYGILCNGTQGHSLPLIDGEGQIEGKEAKATGFEVNRSEKTVTVKADLSLCYPASKKVTRIAEFDLDTGCLTVCDEITAGGCVTDRIVSKKDITDRTEILSEGFRVQTKTELFRNHQGAEETVYILEIKEKNNGDRKERADGERVYCIIYRLHP